MGPNLRKPPAKELELARVLLVDDDLTARLTLKAVLEAGGYFVDATATAAEAFGKLDAGQYALVLSGLGADCAEDGLEVLAHPRLVDFTPAAPILATSQPRHPDRTKPMLFKPEDRPELLGKVADLISQRAARM